MTDLTMPVRFAQSSVYIAGEYRAGGGEGSFVTVDPSTGESLQEYSEASADDVDQAVRAARAALHAPAWGGISPSDRGRLLRRIGEEWAGSSEELATLDSLENGRLLREMRAHQGEVIRFWDYFAGWPDKIEGAVVPSADDGSHHYVRREPIGVVAAFTPWNSPSMMLAYKLAPALAAGNTVVLKPSEHTSASALAAMRVLERAGVPAGVVNVVTGAGPTTGRALAGHPGVDLISFTGGAEGGRAVATAAARRTIPCVLELGGKSPNIVFADADLDAAVDGVVRGIFSASGQSCIAGSRLYVEAPVYDQFLSAVAEAAGRLRIGGAFDPRADIGPLAFREHLTKVLGYVAEATIGCRVLSGGRQVRPPGLENGFYVAPTIVDGAPGDAALVTEEIFGPVLVAAPFSAEAEVLDLANDSVYGLAAGVWSRDVGRVLRLAHRLDAGTVWVNTYRPHSPAIPVGGFKSSGYGKENGRAALDALTRTKSVWLGG